MKYFFVSIIILFIIVILSVSLFRYETVRRMDVVFSIPVITYHDVVRDPDIVRTSPVSLTESSFINQIEYLSKEEYISVSLDDLYKYLTFKKLFLPKKAIVITFDDAWKTQITNASPLLQQHGFVATFFINSAWPGNPNFLSWDDVRSLQDIGMEIGGHTVTHTELIKSLDLQTLRSEIINDKNEIESELGSKINVFAYPYNTVTSESITVIKEAGYTIARSGGNVIFGHNQYTLRSIVVERDTDISNALKDYNLK